MHNRRYLTGWLDEVRSLEEDKNNLLEMRHNLKLFNYFMDQTHKKWKAEGAVTILIILIRME